MIYLEEIAAKLQDILNGIDAETIGIDRPTGFRFAVKTSGFAFDSIADNKTGENFIPVFIDLLGGEYDPVPAMKKGIFNVPITIYFPVRFKKEFYLINEFLCTVFVGKVLDWGELSGKCLSTISVATYGEIQGLDLEQFEKWVENNYQKKIEVMSPWRSMDFTLYLKTGDDLLYANQIKYTMAYTYNGQRYPATGMYQLKQTQASSGISIEPISQQRIGIDPHTFSISNIINRSKSLLVYVEDNEFWRTIITAYNNGTIEEVLSNIEFTKSYGIDGMSFSYSGNDLLTSITENTELGDPVSYTFVFTDKVTL